MDGGWKSPNRSTPGNIDDNPLLLANRKAKKLKGLLQRQGACTTGALGPQTILVTSPDGPRIHVKVFEGGVPV